MAANSHGPIGVFDSGVGGLTVYKALREALPHEDFVYLGDTARLPYGAKSPETVAAYAQQAARLLMESGIKMLVVACNTASALAMPSLQTLLPALPCLGVIEPGAAETARASRTGRITVMATESTVRSGAYAAAIHRHRPDADVRMLACNLLVSLAEEGWSEGPEAEMVVKRYLRELDSGFDTLVLGCTHFPLLAPVIRSLIGPDVAIVDSATTTASTVRQFLEARSLATSKQGNGRDRFMVTDSPERFARLAHHFLRQDIAGGVELAHMSLRITPEAA
jgi:glutamate racemase